MNILKIDQSAFIKDLIIEKSFINCYVSVILLKSGSLIEILDFNNYKEIKFHKY